MTAADIRARAEPPAKTPAMRRDALKDEILSNKLYGIRNPPGES
jgi:hypothetical protein